MFERLVEAINLTMNNLNPTAQKLIIAPDNTLQNNNDMIFLKYNFVMDEVLALIGDVNYVGFIRPKEFGEENLSKLINTLITKNKATVIVINDNPISCKILYPPPEIGTKYIDGNYEYSYGQGLIRQRNWISIQAQNGWGIKVIDKTQTDYVSPLTMIQGYPVTNMSWLFENSHVTKINLINWDTSNVTDMKGMFAYSRTTSLNLDSFNTENVTNMRHMFLGNQATTLDLSRFNTARVTNMSLMFAHNQATKFNLGSFNTSKVLNMNDMFSNNKASHLDLSSFTIHRATTVRYMFSYSKIQTITVKNQSDSDKCQASDNFPQETKIIVTES